jgi:UDP-3-O-[3-hydroxymyristoyl] glucosamine N-acyltransferase
MLNLNNLIDALKPKHFYLNNENVLIKNVIKSNIENNIEGVIFWVSPKFNSMLESFKVGTIICSDLPLNYLETKCNYLVFDNPRKAFQLLLHNFFKEPVINSIAKSASIHPTVKLSQDIFIGENVVIEKNCVIGNNVFIGHNTIIHSNTIIGNDVNIGANNTIGGTGFGYEKDENGKLQPIHHIGGVVIHNKVDIGNNTCIDKAVLENTIIGEGSKIDNLVHISHNVNIGKNCVIIAHAMIGGSTEIGDNAWIAPNVALRDGLKIGDQALVGLGSVVIKSVPENEIWLGNPAKKYK